MVAGSPKAQTVEHLAQSHPALAAQQWQTWRIKDTQKGPLVWHVKHSLVHIKDERGLPEGPYHLLVCYHPFTSEIKYFLSNAPVDAPVKKLLRVAFGRWRIERCFEDGKGEVGLDHWEGRRWIGLKRHLILTTVSYLFLTKACQRLRREKSGLNICQLIGMQIVRAKAYSTAMRTDQVTARQIRNSCIILRMKRWHGHSWRVGTDCGEECRLNSMLRAMRP